MCSRQASSDDKTYVKHIVRSELDAMSEVMTFKHGCSLVLVSVLPTKNTHRSSKSDISIGVSLTMLEVKHRVFLHQLIPLHQKRRQSYNHIKFLRTCNCRMVRFRRGDSQEKALEVSNKPFYCSNQV